MAKTKMIPKKGIAKTKPGKGARPGSNGKAPKTPSARKA